MEETTRDKIKRLKEEINKLEKSEQKELIEKYQKLIGTCLYSPVIFSWIKITSIDLVTYDGANDYISFNCIRVFYDKDIYGVVKTYIEVDSYNSLYYHEILENLISEEQFMESFEKCVVILRNIINDNTIPNK